MKSIFKKILIFLSLVFITSATINLTTPAPTYASDFGCRYFLGMPSWDCHVQDIPTGSSSAEQVLTDNIWTIASNVLTAMTVLASYLVLGYTIYGGYLYIFSSGDPTKVQTSKKTLTRAFIGIAIVTLSSVILNTIRIALLNNGSLAANCASEGGCIAVEAESNAIITNLLSWFIGSAGVVSLIFIVVGGIGYATSQGDPSKLQKSKQTIIYALIGLAVVALAGTLTAVVSNISRDATEAPEAYNQNIIIAKE